MLFEKKREMTIKNFFIEKNIAQYHNVAVYGIGRDSSIILKKLNEYKIFKNVYLVDKNGGGFIGKSFFGKTVVDFLDIVSKIDCVIVASDKYHIAIETRLNRLLKDEKDIVVLNPFKMKEYYSKNELIINKYVNKENEFTSEEMLIEEKKKRKRYFDEVNAYVNEAMTEVPLFKLIEIETYNRCNGVCEFCPVNKYMDKRKEHLMEEELFYKIISDLERLKYEGRISLFSNNEPLLDKRIFEFSKYLRKHLPKARIHMFTNGTLFTLNKFEILIPELDELIIDNYTQNLKLIKPIEEIRTYCENYPELKKKVSIILRKPKELLTSRGGDAPNRTKKNIYYGISCAFPFQQMIVRPTGEVSLCCNDPLGKNTMGDLNKESIIDVWYGKRFQAVRESIKKGREYVEHCRYCDTFSLYL